MQPTIRPSLKNIREAGSGGGIGERVCVHGIDDKSQDLEGVVEPAQPSGIFEDQVGATEEPIGGDENILRGEMLAVRP